ncbi:hypothetical protein ANCCEY_15694, partial [Ancylostoma ceylanicum]
NDFMQIAPDYLLRARAVLHDICPVGYGWGYGMGMGMYRPWRPYGMWGGYGMGMGMPWGMGMYGRRRKMSYRMKFVLEMRPLLSSTLIIQK